MKATEETKKIAKELGIKSPHLYTEDNLLKKIAEFDLPEKSAEPTEKAKKAMKEAGIEREFKIGDAEPKETAGGKKKYRYKVLGGKVKDRTIREKSFKTGDIIETDKKLPECFEIELVK